VSSASDLLLHLTPCDLAVECDGQSFTIPAMDALGWLRLILADPLDLYQVFPTLAGSGAVECVEDAMWEGRLDLDGLQRLGLEVIGAAGDRPWWVVLRVIAAVTESWSVVHVNQASGKSLAGWLDEVWSNIMSHADPKKISSWVNEVETPPKGFESEMDFDAEERAFLSAMKAVMT
jgi:hypothetical protein